MKTTKKKVETDKKVKAKKPETKKPVAKSKKPMAKRPMAKKTATKKAEPKKITAKKTPSVAEKKPKKVSKKTPKVKPGAPISGGVGRRKRSVARVWLRRGKGVVTINGKLANEYFDTDFNRAQLSLPLTILPPGVTYDFEVNVCGGGVNSQAGAIKLGMARAILASDESMRPALRKYRLLTVDSRNKERKKYGQRGARRKFQFVKR